MSYVKKIGILLPGATILFLVLMVICAQIRPVAAATVEGSIYSAIEVQPLTLVDCVRCHTSHYNWLKDDGGLHQTVACTECHEIFHAYNPLHNNYGEIMPKCSSCHDLPHSSTEPLTKCLDCHVNPHQPLVSIPVPADLEGRCPLCHTQVAASLQAEPSMHTEQECSSCHSEKHGRIPLCAECHENHSPLAVMETPDCLACHPVHTPLQISYPATQANEVCAGCHAEPFQLLQDRITRHSALGCAKCHPSHGKLPECQNCHGEPHNAAIHEKYGTCGVCHGIAHDVSRP